MFWILVCVFCSLRVALLSVFRCSDGLLSLSSVEPQFAVFMQYLWDFYVIFLCLHPHHVYRLILMLDKRHVPNASLQCMDGVRIYFLFGALLHNVDCNIEHSRSVFQKRPQEACGYRHFWRETKKNLFGFFIAKSEIHSNCAHIPNGSVISTVASEKYDKRPAPNN